MIESAQEFIRLRLSRLPSEYRRAAHEEAPDAVWRDLVANHPEMRSWVAHNKTVPIQVLAVLSRDPDPQVRHTVAGKRKIPEDMQLVLAGDADEGVRHSIACNAKVTKRVLEILAADRVSHVREIALKRLEEGRYVA